MPTKEETSLGDVMVKEEIVLMFFKNGEPYAIERKNGGDTIHRYHLQKPTWGSSVELFNARSKEALHGGKD